MNFRFAPGSIRVRLSNDEFSQLRSGKTLSLEVCLPSHHVFRARVSAAAGGEWHLDSDPTGMWVSVSRSDVEFLAEDLPSKEGIEHVFETAKDKLVLSLEVDVKKRH
jgi:hypothetical protein